MMHVHKDRTDALTLVDVANDFVRVKENRKQLFGKFSAKISQTSSLFRHSQHKRKIRDKTRGIVHNCSDDLTCTKKYALTDWDQTRGRGGGLMWATRSAPPAIFCLLQASLHEMACIRRYNEPCHVHRYKG